MWYFLVSCLPFDKESDTIPFEPLMEPLEEIRVELPSSDTEPYPESIEWLSVDAGDYAWVHARGYLHTNVADAWMALRNDLVYVNQREATEYTIEELSSDEYDYVFIEDCTVDNLVTVTFKNEWRHLATQGNKESPEEVVVRWQKIEGTEFIESLEGSVQILPVDGQSDIVEIRIIEHLTALLDQEDNAIQYVTEMAERWRLVVHGEAIPTYE